MGTEDLMGRLGWHEYDFVIGNLVRDSKVKALVDDDNVSCALLLLFFLGGGVMFISVDVKGVQLRKCGF